MFKIIPTLSLIVVFISFNSYSANTATAKKYSCPLEQKYPARNAFPFKGVPLNFRISAVREAKNPDGTFEYRCIYREPQMNREARLLTMQSKKKCSTDGIKTIYCY